MRIVCRDLYTILSVDSDYNEALTANIATAERSVSPSAAQKRALWLSALDASGPEPPPSAAAQVDFGLASLQNALAGWTPPTGSHPGSLPVTVTAPPRTLSSAAPEIRYRLQRET